jgi:hypothetical protein
LKLMVSLGDLHSPNLARPVIQILEQMPVDDAQVGEVKVPMWDTLSRALADKSSLGSVEECRINDSELVAKNG